MWIQGALEIRDATFMIFAPLLTNEDWTALSDLGVSTSRERSFHKPAPIGSATTTHNEPTAQEANGSPED